MKNVQLVVPDLFLPRDVVAGAELPALETCLARAQVEPLDTATLEEWLCKAFGVADRAVAPVTLQAEGMAAGAAYWLRADPVHLSILHDRSILRADLVLAPGEAAQLCAALNEHFAADGLHFAAPHPQRWYLRTETAPGIATHWLSEVDGGDVQRRLPWGAEAIRWHRLLNEVQMLLHAHPVNAAREERGEPAINSVWLWGGGTGTVLKKSYAVLCGDSELARAFAAAAGVQVATFEQARTQTGDVLYVWEGLQRAARRGDLTAWRAGVETLERECVAPLLALLREGRLERLTLDVPQSGASRRFVLTRGDLWKFWRRVKRLERYSS